MRVFKANVTKGPSGKLIFTKTGQAFIDVNEMTANINYITTVCQSRWGEGYKVVTADGLPIDDSAGT